MSIGRKTICIEKMKYVTLVCLMFEESIKNEMSHWSKNNYYKIPCVSTGTKVLIKKVC